MEPQKSLFLPVLLAVLVSGIVFGSLGYYLANNKNTTNSSLTSTNTTQTTVPTKAISTPPTSTATNTTTASTADETASWKTYTNTKFAYSFKYPNTDAWKVYASPDSNALTTSPFIGVCRASACQDARHWVEIKSDSLDTLVNDRIAKLSSDKRFEKKAITLLGLPATQLSYTPSLDGKDLYDYTEIYFTRNGSTYFLGGETLDREKIGGMDDGIFDKILSTFKLN